MREPTIQERHSMLEGIIARAWEDPAFKEALLANPEAALKAEFGFALPEGISLRVIEETAAERYVVLPFKPDVGTEADLSESELEVVVGGVTGSSVCTMTGLGGQYPSLTCPTAQTLPPTPPTFQP